MFQIFFTRRALKGHSKGTWALEGYLDTRALKALGHSKGTWALWHSRHLATQAFGDSGTRRALGHLDTRGTQGTLFSTLGIAHLL